MIEESVQHHSCQNLASYCKERYASMIVAYLTAAFPLEQMKDVSIFEILRKFFPLPEYSEHLFLL